MARIKRISLRSDGNCICDCCSRTIREGASFFKDTYRNNGVVYTQNFHKSCVALAKKLGVRVGAGAEGMEDLPASSEEEFANMRADDLAANFWDRVFDESMSKRVILRIKDAMLVTLKRQQLPNLSDESAIDYNTESTKLELREFLHLCEKASPQNLKEIHSKARYFLRWC